MAEEKRRNTKKERTLFSKVTWSAGGAKVFTAALAVILALMFWTAAMAVPAEGLTSTAAGPQVGSYFDLIARHSGKYLDVSNYSYSSGAPVIQYSCNGGYNQQFRQQLP